MFSVEQVLKFHHDNYKPNRNKEGTPIYLPYLKPRSVRISFNPARISQTIQRTANNTPSIDSNQFIFYGLGDINTISVKPSGYYAAKILPYINHLPVFNKKVFPLHMLPKVFVWESEVRPSTYLQRSSPFSSSDKESISCKAITPACIFPEVLDPHNLTDEQICTSFDKPFVVTIVFKDSYYSVSYTHLTLPTIA